MFNSLYCATGHFCILAHYKCPFIFIIVIVIIIIIIIIIIINTIQSGLSQQQLSYLYLRLLVEQQEGHLACKTCLKTPWIL